MEIKVYVKNTGKTHILDANETTFLDIAKRSNLSETAYLVYQGNKIRELNKKITEDCEIRFIGIEDNNGLDAYRRSVIFLMAKSFYDIVENCYDIKIFVDNVIDNGFYCKVKNLHLLKDKLGMNIDELIDKLYARMAQLVDEDATFYKEFYPLDEAINLFKKYKMHDKERLFHYRCSGGVNIYRLHRFQDYYYGNMLPSTGYLKYFKLYKLDEGFLLQCPNKEKQLLEPNIPVKLFNEFKTTFDWNSAQGVETVSDLNDIICAGDGRIDELIQVQESYHDKQISTIADMIASRGNVKFVMIAGPSSSGKTTFSKRLNIQLLAHKLKPYYIGLDNYFKDREFTPRDENGDYNFECLEAIDIELFNKQMSQLLKGERVELPRYNFILGKKEYKGDFIQLNENNLLVIEGIHGLNDKLSYSLEKDSKFKIYISALTQLNIDEHNRISTSDVRLIRRIIRDARARGTDASGTIDMWNSVRKGEEQYIFPFQEEADVMFNSSLIYELSVMKIYAQPLLYAIRREDKNYAEAKRLIKFLDYFVGIDNDRIPRTSLTREFIGGSFFDVG